MSLQESIALQNPLLARTAQPNALFAPYRLGDLDLSNRLVMSPMHAAVRSKEMCPIRSPPLTTHNAPPPA